MHDHFGGEGYNLIPLWFRLMGARMIDYYVGVAQKLDIWAASAGVSEQKRCVIVNALRRPHTPIPIDLQFEFGLPPNIPVGLVVSGLRFDKGLDMLVEAVDILQRPVALLIVGAGSGSSLCKSLQGRNRRTQVRSQFLFRW